MLNTKELIHLDLNPEVIHELRKLDSNISNEQELNEVSIDKDLQVTVPYHQEKHDAKQGIARVHGESLYEMKDQAWY